MYSITLEKNTGYKEGIIISREVSFTVLIDSSIKKKIKILAATTDITQKELVERALQLLIEVGDIEELEKLVKG